VRTAAGPVVFHTFFEPRGLRHMLVDYPQRFTKRGVIDDLIPVLGNGLLTAEGAPWRGRRSELTPCLAPRALALIVPAMDEAVRTMVDHWDHDDVIDASRDMMHLALTIVGRTLFDVNLGDRAPEVSAAVEQVSRLAYRRTRSFLKLPLRMATPANRAYRRSIDVLRGLVDGIVIEAGKRSPFMRRLHESTASDGDALRHEVMTFLLAGHETTATTLAWTFAHLGRDAGLQERARYEARAILAEGDLTATRLDGLPLIDAIVSETLRLYPPGWMIVRRAEEADEILGYAVPRGSFVVAPVYALHRHPDFWTAPDRFDPDRFLDERVPPDPLIYIPFGAGPRRCIGETFARLEARVLLVRLLDRFALEPVGDLPPPQPLTTLRRPREPVRMRLHSVP